MIELTYFDTETKVHVRVEAIIAVESFDMCTFVWLDTGWKITVSESAEIILKAIGE